MKELHLIEKCSVCGSDVNESFVGVQLGDELTISFPRGYCLSEKMSDEEIRNQVFLLLSTINLCQKKLSSNADFVADNSFETDFPFFSYLYVLYDYMARGYYRETETYFKRATSGNIKWNKTIRNIKPIIQDGNVIYREFLVQNSRAKNDELIHLIQQYCLYLSFEHVGWLFTDKHFEEPKIKYDQTYFTSVVVNKLIHTFNDKNKQLFVHMLNIINSNDHSSNTDIKRFGTNRFEYVWETMIDKVFGIDNKDKYYPTTVWMINGEDTKSADLRPDTIMRNGSAVLVLDAKYYRYGITGNTSHLPDSSSTHKQITYGEYIDNNKQFKSDFGEEYTVYNAFLLPFDTESGPFKDISNGRPYFRFGESISNWKGNEEPYERVQGILVDVRHLLNLNLLYSSEEADALTKEIVENVE